MASSWSQPPLFVTKRLDRMDARGASCRQVGGNKRNSSDEEKSSSIDPRIDGADLIEQGRHQSREAQSRSQTENGANDGQAQAVTDDRLQHIPWLGS